MSYNLQMPSDLKSSHRKSLSSNGTIVFVAVVAVLIRLYLEFRSHRTVEDFYITLRYAENISRGVGFVFNPGEHVMGTTTPLYTLFLALADKIGMSGVLAGKAVNIIAEGLTCLSLYRFGVILKRPRIGLITAALYAIWPVALYWAVSGMETSLVTLTGLLIAIAVIERNLVHMAVCSAVLILLRIDGLLIVLCGYIGTHLLDRKRTEDIETADRMSLIGSLGLTALLLLPWIVYATKEFGTPVPTSLVAKLHVYAWQARTTFPNIKPFLAQFAKPQQILALIGFFPGLAVAWKSLYRLRPFIIWMLIYYAGMALSKSFLFGWYFLPPVPFYLLISVIGWKWIVSKVILMDLQVIKQRAANVIATSILIVGIAIMPMIGNMMAADQDVEAGLLKTIGLSLRQIVKPGAKVMMEPIGYIGYFSQVRILDAVGLVSPEVIPFFRKGAISPYQDILRSLRPEYVLLRSGELQELNSLVNSPHSEIKMSYHQIHEYKIPGATMTDISAFTLFERNDLSKE